MVKYEEKMGVKMTTFFQLTALKVNEKYITYAGEKYIT